MRCNRSGCHWTPDPDLKQTGREQLAEHAQAAAHWLCRICSHSLHDHDPVVVCERCLHQAQTNLASVLELWAELPGVLARPAGSADLTRQRGGNEEFALPGGDALVLSGPGSYLAHARDSATGDRAGDDLPPAVVLHQWAMDWHEHRGELYPHSERTTSRRAGRWAARYLETHARWAASNHEAFDEFCSDLAALVGRMQRVTGHHRAERIAAAACFDCGGQLVHRVIDGLEEEGSVRCRQCGQVYTGARYLLALAGSAKSGLDDGWVSVKAAALASRRSERTLRSEVERGLVPAYCALERRRPTSDDPRVHRLSALMVWYPTIEERARAAAARAAAREARQQAS